MIARAAVEEVGARYTIHARSRDGRYVYRDDVLAWADNPAEAERLRLAREHSDDGAAILDRETGQIT